jgi:hypothetical protein
MEMVGKRQHFEAMLIKRVEISKKSGRKKERILG